MIDIVDSQVHVARGAIGATLEAMDALAITSVLIDEFWGSYVDADPTHIAPGYVLPNGAWRAVSPTAEEASILHPDRFSCLVRIDRLDPALESVMKVAATTPSVRAFRLQPCWTLDEVEQFGRGAYEPLLEIAAELHLPICVFMPGYAELLAPYARKFPQVQFVVDHCGMGFAGIPPGRLETDETRALATSYLDEVLKLAEYPNVAMKWSHAQDRFGTPDYPFAPLRPLLRRAIEAFGADRLMWASDKSTMYGFTWSDLVHYLRDDPELSLEEKAAILGGTARRIWQWPAPATPLFPTRLPTH